MALTLASCTRVREPGFSRSECLELADMIERGDLDIRTTEQFHRGSSGRLNFVTPTKLATIVAALREYASE